MGLIAATQTGVSRSEVTAGGRKAGGVWRLLRSSGVATSEAAGKKCHSPSRRLPMRTPLAIFRSVDRQLRAASSVG